MKKLLIQGLLLISINSYSQKWYSPKEGQIELGINQQDLKSMGGRFGAIMLLDNNSGIAAHFYFPISNADIPYVSTYQALYQFGDKFNFTVLSGIATHKFSKDGGRDKVLQPDPFYVTYTGGLEAAIRNHVGEFSISVNYANRFYIGTSLIYLIN